MTVSHTGPLVAALKARLEFALIEGGLIEEEDGDPVDVPVFTNVTTESHRLYVRLEGFAMFQGNSQIGHSDRHTFLVRVVHENMGELISDPIVEIPRIEGLIQEALADWEPLENSNKIQFRTSFEAEEPNPDVQSRISRYQVNIYGE